MKSSSYPIDYSKLSVHINDKAIFFIEKWLHPYWFYLIIKNPRDTKLGDYRYPMKGTPHKITINAGMPPSLCFLTLTHEIAHLIAFDQYSRSILPHGKEWKSVFSSLLFESIEVYEADLKILIMKYAKNPKASYYADKDLSEYFNRLQNPNQLLLKDLKHNYPFKIKNRTFFKLEKAKSRYICIEEKTNKKYLIDGNAPIEEVNYYEEKE
ncbi:transcription elongation protein SprT [Apibacter raozihei]|uniref:transcription elongation protein SprT n=1 Tax=Apibacter raozihei TaxID=2500547 RepID=UPI000FE2DFC2|nr:transcription elongation protein SprT [Apibacter raozihei]